MGWWRVIAASMHDGQHVTPDQRLASPRCVYVCYTATGA